MSEQLYIERLDEAISGLLKDYEALVFAEAEDRELSELVTVAADLRLLPRASFKLDLRDKLIRSAQMTATRTEEKTASTKPVYPTITPYLTVKKAEQLVDFVKGAFGGKELFRAIGSAGGLHCEVMVGDSKLMIGGMESVEEIPTALHLYVPNADEVYQRALGLGATSVEEPVDQPYGDREAGIKDPTGNIWWIATHKLREGSYVPEDMRSVTPFLHPVGAGGLIDFMKKALAAEEVSREASPDGVIHHAVVRIGDSLIELGEAHGDAQPMPPALYTFVKNVDESYQRALDAGAESMKEPEDESYGHRMAWVKDAWGNVWYLAAEPGTDQR
jgi:uncharacterized glyoxalase superfamily protein PhnB